MALAHRQLARPWACKFLKSWLRHCLGVRCRRDLRWSSNCTKICNKANKRLGLLRRTLKPCDKSVKEQAYLSMVRPLVKYATSAWSPYTNRVVSKLEQVQKNAARVVQTITIHTAARLALYHRWTGLPLRIDASWRKPTCSLKSATI